MAVNKIEIQDENGNIYHPHTTSDVVFRKDGLNVDQLIQKVSTRIGTLEDRPLPVPVTVPKYRYIKVVCKSNNETWNFGTIYAVHAYDGVANIALNAKVEAYGTASGGSLTNVTDGKLQKDDENSYVDIATDTTPDKLGGVIVDLGVPKAFQSVLYQFYVKSGRIYYSIQVLVSNDKANWTTLYNANLTGDESQTQTGKIVLVPGVSSYSARYNNYIVEKINEEKDNTLRIATFNTHGLNINFYEYTDYISENKIDFIGIQEGRKNYNTDKLKIFDITELIVGEMPSGLSNIIQGRKTLTDFRLIPLRGEAEKRYLVNCKTIYRGEEVSLYTTHLSYYEPQNRPIQYEDIQKVLDEDKCKYKIITGDFNPLSYDEYKQLKGYISCQGYNDKYFNTCDDNPVLGIDNIFVTPNIKIKRVFASPTRMGSDHNMLIADLELT